MNQKGETSIPGMPLFLLRREVDLSHLSSITTHHRTKYDINVNNNEARRAAS
jgi:hypothetical protein